jgi:hypothetical protein
MRWFRDLVLLLALLAICGGLSWWQLQRARERDAALRAAAETHRLELEVRYRAATKAVELNARGWPRTVDPAWFDRGAPVNPLLTDDHPWVEVASPEEADLLHPPVRIALKDADAMFWYNPHQGVVRARVPVMVSDQAALDLYNKINAAALPSIHWDESAGKPRTTTLTRPTAPDANTAAGAITDKDQHPSSDVHTEASTPPTKPAPRREPTVVIVKRKSR